ncbi:hypothetical protein BC828DRAFT_376474 [Blastocladiella britannica]|nr:hypothetical protein BC828DRAFT_376474 [Blastocladiella britannica]
MNWIISAPAVAEGATSILNDNVVMFYVIHLAALICIVFSVSASMLVLAHVYGLRVPDPINRALGGIFTGGQQQQQTKANGGEFGLFAKRTDLSARFAVYLALADTTWGFSHSIDHLYLIVNGQNPSHAVAKVLGSVVWIFFGYHVLMHACLSLYTYLRVCKNTSVPFGAKDWKLHAACFGTVLVILPVLLAIQGIGNSGYWCLAQLGTPGGAFVFWLLAAVSGFTALATYESNRRVALKLSKSIVQLSGGIRQPSGAILLQPSSGMKVSQKSLPKLPSAMMGGTDSSPGGMPERSNPGNASGQVLSSTASADGGENSHQQHQHHSERSLVASKCLTTLVRTAFLLYVPLTLACSAIAVCFSFNIMEPMCGLFLVVVANLSGFMNARAYFINERRKAGRRARHGQKSSQSGSHL